MAFPIIAVLGAIGEIVGKVLPDPTKAAEIKVKIMELAQQGELKELDLLMEQVKLNAVEAQGNWFQKGWRPFIGWTCGLAFAYNFVVLPLLTFIATVGFGVSQGMLPPALSMGDLMPVLLGMLGLSGMRTFERATGKA